MPLKCPLPNLAAQPVYGKCPRPGGRSRPRRPPRTIAGVLRRTFVIAAAVATAAAGVGCRQNKQPLPAACDEGAATVAAALARAPAPVRVSGTPLSACLNEA